MLRAIRNDHIRPRLLGFRVNSTTSTVAEVNPDNCTITDHSAGATTLTLAEVYARTPVVVATCDTDVGDGAIANYVSASKSTARVLSSTNAGAATDGTIHVLTLGWDSDTTDIVTPSHSLRSSVSGPRLIGFGVDGTGTASLTSGKYQATLVDNDTGDYTLTFNSAFAEAPVVVGTVLGATAGVVNVATVAVNTVNIKTFDADGAAADYDFCLLVLGRDHADVLRIPGRGRIVHTPQRLPRILGFNVVVTAGTPVITTGLGSLDGAMTDNGSGDYTITFTTPFKRTPEVVVIPTSTNICTVAARSTTATQILSFTNAGNSTEAAAFNVICLGYDDATEY